LSDRQANAAFIKGVNYGNRFIPEDWMKNIDSDSIYGPKYGSRISSPGNDYRVSLADV
jgi:hypothetical protein